MFRYAEFIELTNFVYTMHLNKWRNLTNTTLISKDATVVLHTRLMLILLVSLVLTTLNKCIKL